MRKLLYQLNSLCRKQILSMSIKNNITRATMFLRSNNNNDRNIINGQCETHESILIYRIKECFIVKRNS